MPSPFHFKAILLGCSIVSVWPFVSLPATNKTPVHPTPTAILRADYRRHDAGVDADCSENPTEDPFRSTESQVRRNVALSLPFLWASFGAAARSQDDKTTTTTTTSSRFLTTVTDPETYSAVVYTPPDKSKRYPLLLVLHGAGTNSETAWALTDLQGEHAGLAPSLLQSNQAPADLADNFVVVAPYSAGKRSFYEEPRAKLLRFLDWFLMTETAAANVDPRRLALFGFSDGATVAIELATTRRFGAVVIAAYGYSGKKLPSKALDLLRDQPVWVFHSADDVIFPVAYSDRLVRSLRSVATDESIVRYTRFDRDQEGFTGSVRGHSTGITASKSPEIYQWMLSVL